MKTSEQLMQELSALDIKQFLADNSDEFVSEDAAAILGEIIESKSIPKATAIEKSSLNQIYGYQIFSGVRTPSRDKFLPICLAVGLTLSETQEVLCRMKLPTLYIRNRRDCIIIYAINKGLGVLDCNLLLYEAGEKILG